MADFNATLFERGADVIWLANQADANTDITGDWIKLTNYARVGILLSKLGSEDVDDLGLQFIQATTNGGTSKALSLPANRPIWYKTGTLTSQTVWTKTSLTADADGLAFGSSVPTGFTRTVADVNTNALLLYTELLTTDLDCDGGYAWMTCFIEGDNVDNSCLISVQAVMMGGRFPQIVPLSCIS